MILQCSSAGPPPAGGGRIGLRAEGGARGGIFEPRPRSRPGACPARPGACGGGLGVAGGPLPTGPEAPDGRWDEAPPPPNGLPRGPTECHGVPRGRRYRMHHRATASTPVASSACGGGHRQPQGHPSMETAGLVALPVAAHPGVGARRASLQSGTRRHRAPPAGQAVPGFALCRSVSVRVSPVSPTRGGTAGRGRQRQPVSRSGDRCRHWHPLGRRGWRRRCSGRVGRWSFTTSLPQNPDVSLSAHPARANP